MSSFEEIIFTMALAFLFLESGTLAFIAKY
jgi:hypothetical protein